MRARFVIAAGLTSMVLSSGASAQATQCTSTVATLQDACQQAVDVFAYMSPQLGLGVAGGNATLGQGGALGGLPHFSLGLRVNAIQGTLPQVEDFSPSTTGLVQRTDANALPTKSQILPVPTVDAAIGLFKGLPLGVTNVGGVDLLVSATYIPKYDGDEVDVETPDGSLKMGIGARVGLVQESLLFPGVSVTYLRRDLPTVSVVGSSGTYTLSVENMKVKTNAWRVVASKSLIMLGIAVGVGQDTYDQSATARAAQGATSTSIDVKHKMTRTNYFADLSMNLPLLKLVGEIGQASGGDMVTYNAFEGKPADASRLYGSVGLRFAF